MHLLVAALLLPLVVATYQPFQAFSHVRSRHSFLLHQNSSVPSPKLRLALPSAIRQNGRTGDLCNSGRDCKSIRQCFDLSQIQTPCKADGILCVCLPLLFTQCSSTADCDDGEVCAVLLPDTEDLDETQICISPFGLAFVPGIVPLTHPGQPGTALSFESCTLDEQCLAPRLCFGQVCAFKDLSETACSTDDECDTKGEVCAEISGVGFFCVSEVVAVRDGERDPSPLPTPAKSPLPGQSVIGFTITPSPSPPPFIKPSISPTPVGPVFVPSQTPDEVTPTMTMELGEISPDEMAPSKSPEELETPSETELFEF